MLCAVLGPEATGYHGFVGDERKVFVCFYFFTILHIFILTHSINLYSKWLKMETGFEAYPLRGLLFITNHYALG